MAEGCVAAQYKLFVGQVEQFVGNLFFFINDGAYLKPVEMSFDSGFVCGRVYNACEFDFDGPLHGALSLTQHEVYGFGQGQGLVAQDVCECHYAPSASAVAVAQHLVEGVVCRHSVSQGSASGKVLYAFSDEIVSVVDFYVSGCHAVDGAVVVCRSQGKEMCLGVAQGKIYGRCL